MDNDNDQWQQVYNLIVEGHSRLGAGIERLDRRLGGIDTRLEGVDARLEGVDARLEGVDTRLEGIDARLNGVDGRLKEMERIAEQRDRRYMGEFEDLSRRLGNRLALEEGATTPSPAPPPAAGRKRGAS